MPLRKTLSTSLLRGINSPSQSRSFSGRVQRASQHYIPTLASRAQVRNFMKAPTADATWITAGQLLIADIIGVGVMSLVSAMAELGWLLGILSLIVFLPLNIYTGILLWKVKMAYPESISYMDIAECTYNTTFSQVTGFLVYLFIFLNLGNYMLVLGRSLALIFFDARICLPYWITIGCFCLVILNQHRLLNDLRWLSWVNMTAIVLSVVVTLVSLIAMGKIETLGPTGKTELIPTNLSNINITAGLSKMAYAYGGQFLYLEIMSEMNNPKDFPKTFMISAPFQIFCYLIVACIGYAYKGNMARGLLIESIRFNMGLRIGALFLFFHMLITYLIKATVLCRAIHLAYDPDSVNDRSTKGKKYWFFITTFVIACAFLISNIVPFFDSLIGILGALIVPFACWNMPIMFYYRAAELTQKRVKLMHSSHESISKPDRSSLQRSFSDMDASYDESEELHLAHPVKIQIWEYPVLYIIFTFGLYLMFFGTYANIKIIVEQWDIHGHPFSCLCSDIWNTCDCSRYHTGMTCPPTSAPTAVPIRGL